MFCLRSRRLFCLPHPCIETAPDGSLLAFAEARKHNLHDPGFEKQDIDLVETQHRRRRTWSAMKVIEDPANAGRRRTLHTR
jgi:hypothetical protein